MNATVASRLLLAVSLIAASAGPVAAAPQSIAIPAYFYPVFPDPLWTQMQNAVPTVSFAVMNPANGAGAAPDSNYTAQIAAAQAAGVKILGYVYSSYATRDAALLKTDIDNYYTWYNVDGIFVDEADNNCINQPYYADLNTYTKAKGGLGLTVINPGTIAPECFVTAADIILNFEGSYMQYLSWVPSGWEQNYDPSHFWHLIYATPEPNMPSTVLMSQARGAGYVYVTPDMLLPNPWDSLPGEPYWSTERAYVQPVDGACATPVSKPKLQIKGLDTPDADDRLGFGGRFMLAGMPAIDPIANGLRFSIGDSGGVEVDDTLPAGAYAGDPGAGWIAGTNKWTYRDDSETPAFGISKATIKQKFDGVATRITFKISGPGVGSYPVDVDQLPLTGALLLDPGNPTSLCGEATFPGPKPACSATSDGASIRCH